MEGTSKVHTSSPLKLSPELNQSWRINSILSPLCGQSGEKSKQTGIDSKRTMRKSRKAVGLFLSKPKSNEKLSEPGKLRRESEITRLNLAFRQMAVEDKNQP
ncbi:hypothetical protein C8N47_10114 [Mangrovibacterium marinum]|uniref:Uncharacterized protein n=1 Tax=Mangrovibacterium marinum TaxID=1639118 RepID=A0A2T5C616_9BACT|nr:hypothetical protein C8N47_10114 [Mangrovibacterium marinum]